MVQKLPAGHRFYYGSDSKPLEMLVGPLDKTLKSEIYHNQYAGRLDLLNNYKTVEISTLQAADIIDEN